MHGYFARYDNGLVFMVAVISASIDKLVARGCEMMNGGTA